MCAQEQKKKAKGENAKKRFSVKILKISGKKVSRKSRYKYIRWLLLLTVLGHFGL